MKRISVSSIISILPEGLRNSILELEKEELAGRILRSSFWALSGSVISKGFLLITTIIIARLLGKAVFGELGIIQSTISMFASIAGFGLGITSTKYIAELRDSNPNMTGSIIGSSNLIAIIVGSVFTVLFYTLSPVISERLITSPGLVDEMRLGSFILFFITLAGAQTGALAGFENFKTIAWINITVGLISFPLQILFAVWFGIKGAIVGFGLTFLIQTLTNNFFLRKTIKKYNIKIRLSRSFSEISYLWKFSFPALLGGIVISISLWYANTLLVSSVNGISEMAIYNAAIQWQNIVLFIPMAISQISLPLFSNCKSDKTKLFQLIKYNILLNSVVCLVLALLFAVFSATIMRSYGDSFMDGTKVLILLVFTAVLISINSVVGQLIGSLGRMWTGFVINLVWASIFLLMVKQFLGEGMGAMGLAIAMFIAYLVHSVLVSTVSYIYVKRRF